MKWARESFILVALPVVILVSASMLVIGLESWLRGAGSDAGRAGDGSLSSGGLVTGRGDVGQSSGGAGLPGGSGSVGDDAAGLGGSFGGALAPMSSMNRRGFGGQAGHGPPGGADGEDDAAQDDVAQDGDASGPGGRESLRPVRNVVIGSVANSAGEPLGGVRLLIRESVNLYDNAGRPVFGDTPWRELGFSSPSGTFELDTSAGMVYEIMAEAEGFSSGWTRVGGVAQSPVLTLAPQATFQGVVYSREEGTPIPQVHVRLRNSQLDRSGFTDTNGEFSFSGLLAGPAVLELSHPGYKPVSTVVQLVSGSSAQAFYEMDHGGLLLGRVRFADSAAVPPPHLTVHLRNLQTIQVAGVTQTGLFGDFTFQSLVAGTSYRLTVFANELGVHSLDFVSHPVPGGQQVEVVIEPLWDLTGVVTTVEGAPIPGASVNLRIAATAAESHFQSEATGGAGDFHFSGLQRGLTYEVVAFHPSFSVGQIGGIRMESHGQDGVTVALSPGVRIYGRLTAEAAGPSLGGSLIRLRADPHQYLSRMNLYAVVDDAGDFAFVPIPPSHCQLSVMASGFRALRDEFSVTLGEPEVFLEYLIGVMPITER